MIKRLTSLLQKRNCQPMTSLRGDDFVKHVSQLVFNDQSDLAVKHVAAYQAKHAHDKKTICNAAIRISNGGEPKDAIKILTVVIEQNQSDEVLIGNLAAAYLNDNQPDLALTYINRAIKIAPESPNALKLKAAALCKLDNAIEAVALCDKFLEHYPTEAIAWFSLGMCKMAIEKFEDAADNFRTAYEFDPTHFRAFGNIAAALIGAEKFDQAEQILLESLDIKPNDGMSICNLALVYEHRDQYEAALKLYRRSLRVNPQYLRAADEERRVCDYLESL